MVENEGNEGRTEKKIKEFFLILKEKRNFLNFYGILFGVKNKISIFFKEKKNNLEINKIYFSNLNFLKTIFDFFLPKIINFSNSVNF